MVKLAQIDQILKILDQKRKCLIFLIIIPLQITKLKRQANIILKNRELLKVLIMLIALLDLEQENEKQQLENIDIKRNVVT